AAEMQKTLSQYKRMTAMLDFPVKVNDAISKAGTSREQDTPGSQHFHGTALDLSIANLSQDQVKRLLVAAKQVGFTGFGFGNSILHVD
ncbi:MAG: D-Ala-D-Ala carboxypeptidase family metallohydrolase, partial [Flavobacteriaceae bacterium]